MSESNLAKVAIYQKADELVDLTLIRVNDGFEGGRVSKTDFMSWALIKSVEQLDSATIDEIRRAHFNQVSYLAGLVKRLKDSQRNVLSDEERELLRNVLDSPAAQGKVKRRVRRTKNDEASDQNELL